MYEDREFSLDRESLQDTVGQSIDPHWEADAVLAALKGKEAKFLLMDENFEAMNVKGIVSESTDPLPGSAKLWPYDYQGRRQTQPWAIKILEVYD
ncbi:hypothetical protein ACFLVX_02365 [Chloroflexota bacterium]